MPLPPSLTAQVTARSGLHKELAPEDARWLYPVGGFAWLEGHDREGAWGEWLTPAGGAGPQALRRYAIMRSPAVLREFLLIGRKVSSWKPPVRFDPRLKPLVKRFADKRGWLGDLETFYVSEDEEPPADYTEAYAAAISGTPLPGENTALWADHLLNLADMDLISQQVALYKQMRDRDARSAAPARRFLEARLGAWIDDSVLRGRMFHYGGLRNLDPKDPGLRPKGSDHELDQVTIARWQGGQGSPLFIPDGALDGQTDIVDVATVGLKLALERELAGRIDVRFVKGKLQLRHWPQNLLAALYLHMAESLVGVDLKACERPGCPIVFKPKDRRQHYCGTPCKKMANRMGIVVRPKGRS